MTDKEYSKLVDIQQNLLKLSIVVKDIGITSQSLDSAISGIEDLMKTYLQEYENEYNERKVLF